MMGRARSPRRHLSHVPIRVLSVRDLRHDGRVPHAQITVEALERETDRAAAVTTSQRGAAALGHPSSIPRS